MSEGSLWSTLRKNMAWQNAERHEDKFALGVADVSFAHAGVHGWIELKFLPVWPKRAGTVVRVDHFTAEQRQWLKAKGAAGGHVFVLLQVAREYLLFRWQDIDVVGTTTRDELTAAAMVWWRPRLDYGELLKALVAADRMA
jgi:hypothetical protein